MEVGMGGRRRDGGRDGGRDVEDYRWGFWEGCSRAERNEVW